MNHRSLDQVIALAIAADILPPGAAFSAPNRKPWPVMLMTALGAWLAAIPLLIVLFLAFNGLLMDGPGTYVFALIILGGAIVLLRGKRLPLFVEQLTLPALLVGGGLLGFGLLRDTSTGLAAGLMAVVVGLSAFIIERHWLRILLGAAACALVVVALTPGFGNFSADAWLGLQLAMLGWLAMQWFAIDTTVEQISATFDSMGIGWVLVTLAGLVWSVGTTFLAGSSLGVSGSGDFTYAHLWTQPGPRIVSLAMATAASIWTVRCWSSLQKVWFALAALILIVLAAVMPALGAVLLILAVLATMQRWGMATAAGLAAAWIIGAFYYELAMPLASKAVLMFASGAAFAAIAWSALKGSSILASHKKIDAHTRTASTGIVLCAVAVLVVVNTGIWQKQTLIAEGKPIFLELAPADPRSLMQGDFMRLDFQLLRDVNRWEYSAASPQDLRIVLTVDGRGIATPARPANEQPLGAGEILLDLKERGQGARLGTNAWYFKEGEADRWVPAKYGEFRVDASGHALLVNLRGAKLEPL